MYRKSSLPDCCAIYKLICDLEKKKLPVDKFTAIYKGQLKDPHYYCLICEQDEEIRGVLNLRFEEQLHHTETIAEILEFTVDADYRNNGIGKEMFAVACQIAKEKGCTQIEVDCNKLRTNAHRFYMGEGMHNFHFKFSKSLMGQDIVENKLGI